MALMLAPRSPPYVPLQLPFGLRHHSWTISRAFSSSAPPPHAHTRRVLASNLCTCLSCADLCLQSDDMPNSGLQADWECFSKKGFTFGIVRAWRSGGEMDENAKTTLKAAAAAGFASSSLGAYLYPCPTKPAAPQVTTMIDGLVQWLRHHFRPVLADFAHFASATPPHTRRVLCSTWCSC